MVKNVLGAWERCKRSGELTALPAPLAGLRRRARKEKEGERR